MSMPCAENDPAVLDILMKQWDRLGQDIRATHAVVDRLITIGLALAAAVLAFKPPDPFRHTSSISSCPRPPMGYLFMGRY